MCLLMRGKELKQLNYTKKCTIPWKCLIFLDRQLKFIDALHKLYRKHKDASNTSKIRKLVVE